MSEVTEPAPADKPESGSAGPNSVQGLPEWAQNLIKDTRAEAADYRTRLRTAKDEARGELETEYKAKFTEFQDSHKELEKNYAEVKLSNDKLSVALDVLGSKKVAAFAQRLNGSNIDELKADAQSALEIFGDGVRTASATDPTQGQGTDPKKTTADIMGDFITQTLGR